MPYPEGCMLPTAGIPQPSILGLIVLDEGITLPKVSSLPRAAHTPGLTDLEDHSDNDSSFPSLYGAHGNLLRNCTTAQKLPLFNLASFPFAFHRYYSPIDFLSSWFHVSVCFLEHSAQHRGA